MPADGSATEHQGVIQHPSAVAPPLLGRGQMTPTAQMVGQSLVSAEVQSALSKQHAQVPAVMTALSTAAFAMPLADLS